MEYSYPALFQGNADGSYTVTFPDLPGCISEGKSLGDALDMAQSALTQWVEYLRDKALAIPPATPVKAVKTAKGAFVNVVCAAQELRKAA
jgi:predicted RNase H-like HicB family nuclease